MAQTRKNNQESQTEEIRFSYFDKGYINKEGKAVMQVRPSKETMLEMVYEYITNPEHAAKETEELRTITGKTRNGEYKLLHFPVVTFSGEFSYRSVANLISQTPLLVLDFDEEDFRESYPMDDIHKLVASFREQLRKDKNLSIAMDFTSPNGNGCKVVVYVGDRQGLTHRECFEALAQYIHHRYGVRPDKSGSDVSRTCFLPYDPTCYLCADQSKLKAPKVSLRVWLKDIEHERKAKSVYADSPYKDHTAAGNVYELVERWVSRDVAYAPGTYNRYVSKCGYLLCEFGVSEQEATQWCITRFPDYDASQLRSVVSSCYRNGKFNTRVFHEKISQ